MDNLYMNTAELYDADNRKVFAADIPFYLEWAKKLGGNALELACGTGRVTIPLAEAGIPIWGLDYSPPMLDVLRRKISRLPDTVQRQLHTIHGDMTGFNLPETFKLIFIPFRSFQSLASDEDAMQCLSSVHRHLENDGRFILNVFNPLKEIGDWWIHLEENLDFESTLDSGERVTRHSIRKAYDPALRHLYTDFIYRVYRHDGTTAEHRDSIRLRYFYEEDIVRLITAAGFAIDEAYGWYDGRPVHEGNEFILVCRKG